MRNVRAHIAETAANVRPLVRLADGTCMSEMTQGPDFGLGAGLTHKARM
jgi:hypothetical protein